MTPSLALAHFGFAATKSSSTNPLITLLPLLAIGVLGYFFFIRPQQRKAQAARQTQGSGFDVGDEVQTVGGVIGTVLEVHGDRYTLLTGALGDDGNLDGPQPTRIVFVRQAIAKKIERVEDIQVDDQADETVQDIKGASSTNGSGSAGAGEDIDDVGGDGTASSGEHSGEAEEA
ncbi:MAG TPA: preprotein translocase subunit YajC [Acidimicrobiales bacterium]|jgi:preprotein translocase subunit YajC|nr:preprotein translocase subunit YajC [Acidimicrobiales bacterium]